MVEEEEPKSGWDPSLLVEEEAQDRSAKREKLKAEMVEARKTPLSQRVSDAALAIAGPVVDTISKMNPLTVIPRAAHGAGQVIGAIPADEPFPLEQDKPLVDLHQALVNPVVEAGSTLDELRYGAQQAAADIGQFFVTPAGISTLGAGAAPKVAQGALAAGFAGSMAAHAPEAHEASRQAAESGSMADTARAVLNEVATIAAPLAIGAGALRQGLKPAESLVRERIIEPERVSEIPSLDALPPELTPEGFAGRPLPNKIVQPGESAPAPFRQPVEPGTLVRLKDGSEAVIEKDSGADVVSVTKPSGVTETIPSEQVWWDASNVPEASKPKSAPAPAETRAGAEVIPAANFIGPGAASPIEFAQRSKPVTIEEAPKVFREPPRSEPPGSTPVSSPSPNIEVARANKDYNLFNNINSSQWAFYFGKLGESAKSAIERIFTGEFRMRENINKDTRVYVDRTLSSLPRQFSKQGGKAFFDVVNGRNMEDIRAEFEGKPGGDKVLAATEQLKTRLEEIRTTIRDTKRDSYNAYLNSLDKSVLDDLFIKNMGEGVDVSRFTAAQKADALTLSSLPDDWGIADGTYLPHLFFGNYKVTAGEGAFVTRAKTLAEAKAKIYQLTKNNPELASAAFKVEQDTVVPADMIRLGDKNFWKMVGQMKESLGVSAAEVKEAQSGIIGRKASKQKWFGSLQERHGFEGYSKDFKQVMTAYLNGFHLWKELSAMQRDVQPMIEKVRLEGRPNAANRLDEIMENLWGKPAKSTVEFDAFIRQIPGVRDWIKPLALDRWSRNVRSMVSLLTLRTARFATVNRLQPLQGLYPVVGERLLVKGKALQHSAEGKALLEEGGVSFDVGQYAEPGAKGKLSDLSERFSGEKSNQELAFLSMFLHGQEQGMGRAQAIQYAKLRGQLMTQFTPLISDIPKALSGPFGHLAFQFKRFPIKQAELAAQLVRERNFGGITRMLGVFAVMGGASFYMRQLMLDKERQLRMRRALESELGKKGADVAMYGLPGLVGADLSGSLVLGDEPFGENIYEKAGRQLAGPAVSLAYETGKNVFKAARQPMTRMEKTKAIIRRIPSLKPLAELADLEAGNADVMTPDGEVKYRRALSDAIVGLGSFRSANEANKQLAINAIIELNKEIQSLKNGVFMSLNSDPSKALDAVKAFNTRWPEAAITADELTSYLRRRQTSSVKTDEERTAGRKFRPLIGN